MAVLALTLVSALALGSLHYSTAAASYPAICPVHLLFDLLLPFAAQSHAPGLAVSSWEILHEICALKMMLSSP